MSEIVDTFEEMEAHAASPEDSLVVTVDGFEGPLDLLLALARTQKVDIAKISVLKLAEQYLEFIERARRVNLELAADYLVMAAWLAYLKSRLILPQPPSQDGETSADEMAARLRWRLQRLDAMREAAARLMARDRLGREVFVRGAPEPVKAGQARDPHRHALRPSHRLCDPAPEAGRRQGVPACPHARAVDRGGKGANRAYAGADRQLERSDKSFAFGLAGRGAPPFRVGEYAAGLPRIDA